MACCFGQKYLDRKLKVWKWEEEFKLAIRSKHILEKEVDRVMFDQRSISTFIIFDFKTPFQIRWVKLVFSKCQSLN